MRRIFTGVDTGLATFEFKFLSHKVLHFNLESTQKLKILGAIDSIYDYPQKYLRVRPLYRIYII
jgi:hypothetical protein